jgi:3-phosphoshikimate 1-carboxyvinyltransferase
MPLEEVEKRGLGRELGEDIQATIDCLRALGAPGQDPLILDCRESGSTLRFLLPVAAALGRSAVFTGSQGLARRPLREYVSILGSGGVRLEFRGEENLPVRVEGRLQGGVFPVPGHVSSQYITGLMLALPLVEGDSTIYLTSPLQSAPYVQLTQVVLAQFGVVVDALEGCDGNAAGWSVAGKQSYRIPPKPLVLEADYSQAAFWLAARFLGHEVEVDGLNPRSVQGDRAIVPLLEEMASWPPGEELRISAAQIPDLVPILAVAACARRGATVIEQAERLRLKESDRLHSTTEMLRAMGAQITAADDALIIEGGKQLPGGQVHSHNDHRIAMAAAIAALSSRDGVRIIGAAAVSKSYPNFFQELKRLGGDVRGI